jgi:hypothetical protein
VTAIVRLMDAHLQAAGVAGRAEEAARIDAWLQTDMLADDAVQNARHDPGSAGWNGRSHE